MIKARLRHAAPRESCVDDEAICATRWAVGSVRTADTVDTAETARRHCAGSSRAATTSPCRHRDAGHGRPTRAPVKAEAADPGRDHLMTALRSTTAVRAMKAGAYRLHREALRPRRPVATGEAAMEHRALRPQAPPLKGARAGAPAPPPLGAPPPPLGPGRARGRRAAGRSPGGLFGRDGHGQGAGGAGHPRGLAARTGRSWRSTAAPCPRR